MNIRYNVMNIRYNVMNKITTNVLTYDGYLECSD